MRALIVEDDAVVQGVLKAYLLHYGTEHGYEMEIQVLPDARRALALLTAEQDVFDVVFLGVRRLDLADGKIHSLLEQIRPKIVERIIFVTGHRDGLVANFPERTLNILDKPFRYHQLLAAMAAIA